MPHLPEVQQQILDRLFKSESNRNGYFFLLHLRDLLHSGIEAHHLQIYFLFMTLQEEVHPTKSFDEQVQNLQSIGDLLSFNLYGEHFLEVLKNLLTPEYSFEGIPDYQFPPHEIYAILTSFISSLARSIDIEKKFQKKVISTYEDLLSQGIKNLDRHHYESVQLPFEELLVELQEESAFFEDVHRAIALQMLNKTKNLIVDMTNAYGPTSLEVAFINIIEEFFKDILSNDYSTISEEFYTHPRKNRH